MLFIAELRRRKVVQVMIGYAAVAWLLIQFGSLLLETFQAPGWAAQLLFMVLFIGFPVVIALSWIFDLTPQGILRTSRRELTREPHDMLSAVLVFTVPEQAHKGASTLRKLKIECQRFGAQTAERQKNRLIARFDNGHEALHCAIYLQSIISDSLSCTAALAIGEAGLHQHHLQGSAVETALQLETLSPAGGLAFSNAFYNTLIDHPESPLREHLERIEVNLSDHPVSVYLASQRALMLPKVQSWQHVADPSYNPMGRWVTISALLMLGMIAFGIWRWLPEFEIPGLSAPLPSIAVLPFRDLSQDESNEWLVAGLGEEVLTTIAGLRGFRVVSRRTSMDYSNQDWDITELGEQLGVSHLLEGSVQSGGKALRISIRLSSTTDGSLAWAQNYNATPDNLITLQQDIAQRVASSLEVALSDEELDRLQKLPTVAPEAYTAYLEAIGYLRQPPSNETLTEANRRLERALEIQPDFNDALAAQCRANLYWYRLNKDGEYFDLAEAQCEQALDASNKNVTVLLALGNLHHEKGDQDAAEQYFQRGLSLDSDDVELQAGLARVRGAQGDTESAEVLLQQAIRIEPGSWTLYSLLGRLYISQGRNAEALEQYNKASTLMPNNANVQSNIGGVYYYLGEFGKAAEAFERSLAANPSATAYSNIGTLWYYNGDFEKAHDNYLLASELRPSDYRVWSNLADAENQIQGEEESARDHYSHALDQANTLLEINPEDAEALSLLAWCAVNIGLDSIAERSVNEAVRLAADDPNIAYVSATVYAALGQWEQAQQLEEKIMAVGFPKQIIDATPILKEAPYRATKQIKDVQK